MKLDKAIEILTLNLNFASKKMPQDCQDAIKLGIEALKRVKDNPIVPTFHQRALLPGEDPE